MMHSRHTRTLSSSMVLSLLLITLLPAVSTVLPATLRAQPSSERFQKPDDLIPLREKLMQHRNQEAAAKIRAAQALMSVQAATTANQDLYDVHAYDLNLTVDPTLNQLTGRVAVLVEVTGDSIATVDLDLDNNMTVSATTAGGSAAAFSHTLNILTVTLDHTYLIGDTVTVAVSYSGDPAGASFGWDSHSGQDMIWTLSEPFGAREWWPCKDLNSDKADSVDMRITVPNTLTAVSNGSLVSNVDNGSTRTFHWHSGYAMCTYLVSMAIHPYTFFNDWYTPQGGGSPMEVQFYVYPDHYSSVQTNYAKTVPMIDAYAKGFGEYPFLNEKYGHAEFVWGGGMEHQTVTSLGGWGEDLISHELAHQWFGDYVTCADFGHVWLNEGFATWCEAYWKEQTSGFATYQAYMDAAGYYGPGTIFVEDTSNFNGIFNTNLSYNKASWVVHMLRGVLGDTDFFAGLAAYQALYGYGSATTEQFRDVMETVSGKNLYPFFNQWIYGEYYPVYNSQWNQAGSTLNLTVNQVQTNTGPFNMPIQVLVETTTDTTVYTVNDSLATQDFALTVTGTVQKVTLDPDHWILRRVKEEVADPTFQDGVLLVNGVLWNVYGSEITSAYQDSAFSGDQAFSFWDAFPEPAGGYVAELPAPLGHGAVPTEILGGYSTVIWVGNDYGGDTPKWFDTAIQSFLEVGGNVLLMTRHASSFFDTDLTNYLGVTWAETGVTLQDYTADYTGLANISFLSSQSWNDLFSLTIGPESTLLYRDTVNNRGVGVHAQPAMGGSYRTTGGHFALLSGRPYRMVHTQLRTTVEFILNTFFGEPQPTVASRELPVVKGVRLLPSYPNPFGTRTVIPFSLEATATVNLAIYDTAGRRVRTLLRGEQPAGPQRVTWDGRDGRGRVVTSGIYFIRLEAAGLTSVRSIVLAK